MLLKSKQNKIRGRNPQTRKTIQIPAKKGTRFKSGRGLRETAR
ncbi:hypothetical protein E3J33_00010 [Candidatus Aerophobetes bacterium]|uniref:Uncharacterized protein n=1 Tax=Aerophobetes bacterium TaxID=2030807 RepID=A0A523YSH7_UNCAE|nr:MAG: hypothetical protein E3J33_00010 [Candidatus Aerophobetes bacterium]